MERRINTLFKIFTFISVLTLTSCDDDNAIINKSNLDITIDENPIQGQFLGIIPTDLSGDLTFSITSQTHENAFSIHNSSGEIRVGDESHFDFENNPILKATIIVSNGVTQAPIEVKVLINDIDDIAYFLTHSKTEYTKATIGTWIQITEEEYNFLATNLNKISKSATSDLEYNDQNTPIEGSPDNISVANNNGKTLPKNSYVFAFKYFSYSDNTTGVKVKQSSTGVSHFYSYVGNSLPMHTYGHNYFVLKGSNFPTTDVGHLGIYNPNSIGFKKTSSHNYNVSPSDVTVIRAPKTDGLYIYQGLSTTQQQWKF